jgi:uncharacterized protein (DUF1800 family)
MPTSRRQFLRGSAALAAASLAPTGVASAQEATPAPQQSGTLVVPPEVIALNRMGYGPRPGDVERVRQLGLDAYIAEQLNPGAIADSLCDARLAEARLRIEYNTNADGSPRDPAYPAKRAAEALLTLDDGIAELWPRATGQAPYQDSAEQRRPADEVRLATWIRALYSQRQLLEVLVDFWHNHFNVSRNSATEIAATFPLYDRIFRSHALGRFRVMLEEVGRSVAMMYYLNNVNNKLEGGEGPNENYARELFELHTLGSDNYLTFYNNDKGVGAITYGGKQYARGYVDYDVYQAAAAFTGWSIGNGRDSRPNNGQFFYKQNWHDPAKKIVLSIDGTITIPASQGEQDGEDVFDMLASHPGTARFVCTKLCRRLIGDTPPKDVIDAAVTRWMATTEADNQLAQVIQVILSSNAFRTTWGQKVKRPFDFIVSYLRATEATLPVDTEATSYWGSIINTYNQAGHRLYEWATPTGHPDLQWYWLSVNGLLRRWNLPQNLTSASHNVAIDILGKTDINASCTQIVDGWIARLFGYTISATTREELISFLARGGDPSKKPIPTQGEPNNSDVIRDRVIATVQLMAMSPEFQQR